MEKVKPRSITQIYKSCYAKWFRVRNVVTLLDYLILEFVQIGFAQDPRLADVVCLDDQIYGVIDCTEKKYAMLSDADELAMFRRHKRSAVTTQMLNSYNLMKGSNINLNLCHLIE